MNYFHKFISFSITRLLFAGIVKPVGLSTVKPSGAVIPLIFNTAVTVFFIVNVFWELDSTATVLNDNEVVNTSTHIHTSPDTLTITCGSSGSSLLIVMLPL